MTDRPLDGVKVIELGQLLAGPFAGAMLAYFGADVIKVEPPEGDVIRTWRGMDGDTSVWWRSLARNKRCIAVDLRDREGRSIAGVVDAAIESWTLLRASGDAVAALVTAGIPAGPINDAAAIARDPQLAERGFWEHAAAEGRTFKLPSLGPRLDATPGRTDWAGPALGEHTEEVLAQRLGLAPDAVIALRARGVIR